jgi:hypothetical protein
MQDLIAAERANHHEHFRGVRLRAAAGAILGLVHEPMTQAEKVEVLDQVVELLATIRTRIAGPRAEGSAR